MPASHRSHLASRSAQPTQTAPAGKDQVSCAVLLNNKLKLTTRRAYGFRTPDAVKAALYHNLGDLPEPKSTHKFC